MIFSLHTKRKVPGYFLILQAQVVMYKVNMRSGNFEQGDFEQFIENLLKDSIPIFTSRSELGVKLVKSHPDLQYMNSYS